MWLLWLQGWVWREAGGGRWGNIHRGPVPFLPASSSLIPLILKVALLPTEVCSSHSLAMLHLEILWGTLLLTGRWGSWMTAALRVSSSWHLQELGSHDKGWPRCPLTTPSMSPISFLILGSVLAIPACEAGSRIVLVLRPGHSFCVSLWFMVTFALVPSVYLPLEVFFDVTCAW